MEPSWIVVIFLSLVASAFASGMEIAFITSNKLKIELDRKQGVLLAGIIGHFVKNTKMFIATMLVGNNIALVIYGLYMGDALTNGLSYLFPYSPIDGYGMIVAKTLISTVVVLIFGEFIPKAIFSIHPNRWLNYMAIPLLIWYVVLWLFAKVVTLISDLIILLFTGKTARPTQAEFGSIDLDHYVEQATGNIDRSKDIDHEITIFQNALDFSKVKARDCMIPRNEIVAMEITDPIDALKNVFTETRLSKILIYRESIDHIIGYVHQFELLKRPLHIQHVLRPVVIVPEPMPAHDVLKKFIKEKRSMAVVVDEFGGTAGILTMEDIVEEIFGEIEDEHDKEETVEERVAPGTFLFSARLEIDYLNEKYELRLPEKNQSYDTLGGLFLDKYGDIPEDGESIECDGYLLTAEKVSDHRLEVVKVSAPLTP